MTDEERICISDDLRRASAHVDEGIVISMLQSLRCPDCGGGIDYAAKRDVGRKIQAWEVAMSNPQILDKYSPSDVIGRVMGEWQTRIKCRACAFDIVDGHLVARSRST